MPACEIKNGVPVNAMKIGEFNDNDPIFICRDSRKTGCIYFKECSTKFAILKLCGLVTDCDKNRS